MSYAGYAKHLSKGYLAFIERPTVLEIGIDRGQTTIPLLHNMILESQRKGSGFTYVAIDIKVRPEFLVQIKNMEGLILGSDLRTGHQLGQKDCIIYVYEMNSLDYLNDKRRHNVKFSLVLVDGDHNYYTVKRELDLIEKNFLVDSSVILCDDYLGKYSDIDMFYDEQPGYENNILATSRTDSEKTGVKAAVDDFIKESEFDYDTLNIIGSPCFVFRSDVLRLEIYPDEDESWYNSSIKFLPLLPPQSF